MPGYRAQLLVLIGVLFALAIVGVFIDWAIGRNAARLERLFADGRRGQLTPSDQRCRHLAKGHQEKAKQVGHFHLVPPLHEPRPR